MSCKDSVVHFSCSTEVAYKKGMCRGLVLSELVFMSVFVPRVKSVKAMGKNKRCVVFHGDR